MTDFIEELANILFEARGELDTLSDDQWEDAIGGKRQHWPDIPEWERDEYRHQAKAAMEFFKRVMFGIDK